MLIPTYIIAAINQIFDKKRISYDQFAKGLLIIFSSEMHQIETVLKCNETFTFLCTKFNTVKFYKFANCIEIEKSKESTLINHNELVCKRTYEAKTLNDRIQIIADDVDMIPNYEKYIV